MLPVADISWAKIGISAIRCAATAYKYKKFLCGLYDACTYHIGLTGPNILVVGRPGVGKSFLLERMTKKTVERDWSMPAPSLAAEHGQIDLGTQKQIMLVAPGQDVQNRSIAIGEAFNTNKIKGVIYVTDWGHTEHRIEGAKEYSSHSGGLDAFKEYQEAFLTKDAEDIIELCGAIKTAKFRPKWLMVAVNKVDLFYDKLSEVEDYYRIGANNPFMNAISRVQSIVGAERLHCVVRPVSAWATPFKWPGGEFLPCFPSNDVDKRYFDTFCATLDSLCIAEQ